MLRNLISSCRQNVSMVTVLRHYAGSTGTVPQTPQTTVTKINRNVTLEQHAAPSDMPRPLVILLGWMFAKPTHLNKFTNLYLEQGFDVITLQIRMSQLLFPKRVQAITRGLMDLCQSDDLRFQPLMTHGFSSGGYVYGEFLANYENNPETYSNFGRRLCAQVLDSPVDFYGVPKGLARAVTDNEQKQDSVQKSLEWYLSTFSNTVLRDYKISSQVVRANRLRLPSIIFYSLSDPACDPEGIEAMSQSWRDMGLESSTVFWEKAPHVSTFKTYPEQYKQSLLEFIRRSGIKGVNPIRDMADEDDEVMLRPLRLDHISVC